MNWSKLRKLVTDRFADSVRDRVELRSTTYRKMHDQLGRGWIAIDKREILDMPTIIFEGMQWMRYREKEQSYAEAARELHEENLFSQSCLHEALAAYLNESIEEILVSDNPIIRALGMLDARLGLRRLREMDVSGEHDLVKRLYHLRCAAENIPIDVDLTARIDGRWKKPRQKPEDPSAEEALVKLGSADRTRKTKGLILRVYRKELPPAELDTDLAKIIQEGFENAPEPEALLRLLLMAESRTKLLKTVQYARGLIALARNVHQWLRPLEIWTPRSHNTDAQFSSLARHLWAIYEVPLFMDQAWLRDNVDHQNWFRHLGAGQSIRTAAHLPFPMTRKMAHYFALAPPQYTIEAALRWCQIQALGGDERLADALQETRLAQDFSHNDFWFGVLRFFIRHPMLDTALLNPIIDYIWHQRFEPRIVFVERGVAEELGPAQPNFSMHGRTVESLLQAVRQWHRQLGRETKGGDLQWERSGLAEFQFVEGSKRAKNMRIWRIRELLSTNELVAEGREMKHCVATYAQSCHKGICSIWTMEAETELGREKCVTIEVQNATRLIRQVRGRLNRRPTDEEKAILGRWATEAGLELATYI